ncbi:DUF502 domain-containing protein [Leeia sp.]|uniref:DUF502 domain-containing protein n=1 Tax=Leeia sp. TaxID=2884678 RepID=UPI0035AF1383
MRLPLATLRRYLLTGLLIWVPLVITLWVLNLVVGTLDGQFSKLPLDWQPNTLLYKLLSHVVPVSWLPASPADFHAPGLGVIITLLVLILTGVTVSNMLGRQLLRLWEHMLNSIPVVKSIYSSVKQVSDTLFSSNGQAFRKALLVQYPREGSWTIAFQTGTPSGEVAELLPGQMVGVYVPTTPNPTSGFFLMMPVEDVRELEMSVDEALKYVISMGVVPPKDMVERSGQR